MNESHQVAGVYIRRVPGGRGRQNRQEVALLLGGNSSLVGHLMGCRGRQQTGRAVHIYIGFPRIGAVEAGKVDNAHQPGKIHPLDPGIVKGQEGKLLLQRVIDVGIVRQNFLPGDGKQAVFVPRDLPCRLAELLGKLRRHGGQIFLAHRLA